MSAEARIEAGLQGVAETARACAVLVPALASAARRYTETLERGGTLLFAGNGGSAADAQHLATEYVVRFRARRRPLAALALTTDSSLLTAASNDLGFEQVFARQLEAIGRAGDLLSLHSTSGDSPNLLAAARSARARGITVVAFLGRGGGALRPLADEAIVVPSDTVSRIQEMHLALEHLIVEVVEENLTR
jgi:D-sedoheptulose 7-phosphate isomerase